MSGDALVFNIIETPAVIKLFPARQGAEGNSSHSGRNIGGTGNILYHRQKQAQSYATVKNRHHRMPQSKTGTIVCHRQKQAPSYDTVKNRHHRMPPSKQAPSYATVKNRHHRMIPSKPGTILCHRQKLGAQFKRGDFSTCVAPRPGRPETVTIHEHLDMRKPEMPERGSKTSTVPV